MSSIAAAAALCVFAFLLAAAVELHETMSRWTSKWEFWEVDEVPTAITVLALGLAWFAFRRKAEAATALRLRAQAQDEALRLLEHNRELARQRLRLAPAQRRRAHTGPAQSARHGCGHIERLAAFDEHQHQPLAAQRTQFDRATVDAVRQEVGSALTHGDARAHSAGSGARETRCGLR